MGTMRKILFSIIIFVTAIATAQVPRWIIHPSYDSIKMLGNGYYVVSKNNQFGMLDSSEKVVLPIQYDSISVFNSHHALLFSAGKCVGYVSDEGKVTDISEFRCEISGINRFSCGYLVIFNNSGYYYVNAETGERIGPLSFAAPFSENYAWVRVPNSLKHVLDGSSTYHVMSAKTGELVKLALGEYDSDDIDFISSCSNGKSIIVLKKRFYEYEYKTNSLIPLSTDGNPENKKSRVMALERPLNVSQRDDGYITYFKQGYMTFDYLMRLTGIAYYGQDPKHVEVAKDVIEKPQSSLTPRSYADTPLLGLVYDGTEILSAQFDKVSLLWGDQALVMQNGKYGLVGVDRNAKLSFSLNDNLNIGFEHKTVNTMLKATCPPYMDTKLMTISSTDDGYIINVDTRKENTNVETSVLTYACTLKIPEEIGLEPSPTSTEFVLNYDGLKFSPFKLNFNKWYINNYEVLLASHQISGSELIADIVVKNNAKNDGTNYFYDVDISASDSVACKFNKVNEGLYKATFSGWRGDLVYFTVGIQEDGCPQLVYPFPVKTRNTSQKDAGNTPKVIPKVRIKTPSAPVHKPASSTKKIMVIPK